jgi:hypothetical protein
MRPYANLALYKIDVPALTSKCSNTLPEVNCNRYLPSKFVPIIHHVILIGICAECTKYAINIKMSFFLFELVRVNIHSILCLDGIIPSSRKILFDERPAKVRLPKHNYYILILIAYLVHSAVCKLDSDMMPMCECSGSWNGTHCEGKSKVRSRCQLIKRQFLISNFCLLYIITKMKKSN